MNTTVVVVIVLIVLALIVLGVVAARRSKSKQLQQHFGPEYERSVTAASGDRRAAESELAERQQRRQELDVRDLRPEERSRFRDSWNEIQRGFVDDPRQSLHSADLLVAEVMRTRGYPVDDDFDRRADALSVDHPRVVQHYREARSVRDAEGEVDTENQRTAVTSYRALINALLGDDDDDRRDDRRDDDRRDDDRATGHTQAAGRDGNVADERADRRVDPTDHSDTTATGRHALREDQPRPDATGPADPNGPQSPRTEERTR